MARFEIRFVKDVCNDTGHLRSVLQRALTLEADTAEAAQTQACVLFCASENIGHWRDHADRVEIAQIDWSQWRERA